VNKIILIMSLSNAAMNEILTIANEIEVKMNDNNRGRQILLSCVNVFHMIDGFCFLPLQLEFNDEHH
jgi:hypothetical protein